MKRLLATTMLVGFTASSAMAADVTISGSFELGYVNSSQNDAYTDTTAQNESAGDASNKPKANRNYVPAEVKNGTTMYVLSDVNIAFESTTDSGLTMKMNYGLDENGSNDSANTDDINFSISGGFGEIYATGKGDDSATRRLDIEAKYTADAVSTVHTIEDTGTWSGTAGEIAGGVTTFQQTIVSYFIPANLIDGLKAGVSFDNGGTNSKANGTEWAVQYSGEMSGASYTVHYGQGTWDANGAAASSTHLQNGGEASGYGLEIVYGNLTLGTETSTLTANRPTQVDVDFDLSASSIKYEMGDITFAYATEKTLRSNRTNDDVERQSASVSYAIAPGLTANITTSSTKEDEGVNQDEDDVTVFALNATF